MSRVAIVSIGATGSRNEKAKRAVLISGYSQAPIRDCKAAGAVGIRDESTIIFYRVLTSLAISTRISS